MTRTTPTRRWTAPLLALAFALSAGTAPAADEGFSAGLSVQPRTSAGELGLPLYPGAVPERDRDGDSGEGATISLWGGPFSMDLRVMKLRSSDSVEAVAQYYRESLARQGRLVDCGRDAAPEPAPEEGGDGKLMRCGKDRPKAGGFLYKLALPGGVRMVAIEPAPGGGARIQLVRLLLRGAD